MKKTVAYAQLNKIHKHFDTIDSTMIVAKSIDHHILLDNNYILITADRQTSGLGRKNHTQWLSLPGNVFATYIFLLDQNHASKIDFISFAVCNSLIDLVSTFCSGYTKNKVSFKWPNDILLDGKKVSGMLFELEKNNHNKSFYNLTIGIGININATHSQLKTVNKSCTSFFLQTGQSFDLQLIIKMLSKKILYSLDCLIKGEENFIASLNPFLERFGNMNVVVQDNSQKFLGTIEYISDQGFLAIKQDKQNSLTLVSKNASISQH